MKIITSWTRINAEKYRLVQKKLRFRRKRLHFWLRSDKCENTLFSWKILFQENFVYFSLKISFQVFFDRNNLKLCKHLPVGMVTSFWFAWRELMVLNFYQLVPFVIPPSVRDNNCWLNNNFLHSQTMSVCVSTVCKYLFVQNFENFIKLVNSICLSLIDFNRVNLAENGPKMTERNAEWTISTRLHKLTLNWTLYT